MATEPKRNRPKSDARADAVIARLRTPVLIAALLTLPAVAISETHPTDALKEVAIALNWFTWSVFVIELIAIMSVVPDRLHWLRKHPLELVIVFLTPPVLPPTLQSLRVFRLLRLLRLIRLASLSREVFSLEGLAYAALLALLTVVGGGAVFDAFEAQQHLSAWEGVYWAITTMTTVGSNIYPETTGGQVTSCVLVLMGISFVALLTGAIAQRFLGEASEPTPEQAPAPKS